MGMVMHKNRQPSARCHPLYYVISSPNGQAGHDHEDGICIEKIIKVSCGRVTGCNLLHFDSSRSWSLNGLEEENLRILLSWATSFV